MGSRFICLVIQASGGLQSQRFLRLERLLVQSASSTFTSSARWSRSPPASVWTVSPRQSKAEMLLPVFLLTNDRWSFSFDAASLWPMVFFVVAGKNVLPAYYGINFCTRCALNFNFLVGKMYFWVKFHIQDQSVPTELKYMWRHNMYWETFYQGLICVN